MIALFWLFLAVSVSPFKSKNRLAAENAALRRRVAGHRKPQQVPPSMADNKKGKQPLEGQGWNHAQIDRRNCVRMGAQECPPALRWRCTADANNGRRPTVA